LQPEKVPPISELGPDALLQLPSAADLILLFKAKKGSIKALLLDQVLQSIGNISWNSVWHFKLWEVL
jgi:formamidopyrimidine-DNA glycosylase